MSSLPLQPAFELATKSDIEELRMEIRELRAEFGEFHKALRQQMMFTIAAMTALTAIFSVIVGLVT